MKYPVLRLEVYRSANGDSTNNGISSTNATIYMVDPKGFPTDVSKIENLVFTPEDCGNGYKRLIPIKSKPNSAGPMFGGNLAYLRYNGTVEVFHIHDRFETWDQYRGLTR